LNKAELRSGLLKKREALSREFINAASENICEKVCNHLKEFNQIQSVGFYAAFRAEVDLIALETKLTKLNVQVYYPKIFSEPMRIDFFRRSHAELRARSVELPIFEPETLEDEVALTPDVVIVPGIGFDKRGFRLGYGKGYYDKYLKNFNGVIIGVAFDFQMLEKIPNEAHDIKLDLIITEKEIYK